MASDRHDLVDLIRRRLLAGMRDGTLAVGDRVASARELSGQLDVDPRVVLAAYRQLADEGMVEMRPRSGIYLTARSLDGEPAPTESWLVELLAEGVERELPAPALGGWLNRAVDTLRLRALVVARTTDQLVGICRELRWLYGLQADGAESDAFDGVDVESGPLPDVARRADLVVATGGSALLGRQLAARLRVSLVLADVRPDLLGAEWRRLLAGPAYVLVADERFGELVRGFVATADSGSLRILVAGRDDVSVIPADAPVYVTRAAQERLGVSTTVPGRRVPPARIFSGEVSRAVLRWVVTVNLAAASARDSAAGAGAGDAPTVGRPPAAPGAG